MNCVKRSTVVAASIQLNLIPVACAQKSFRPAFTVYTKDKLEELSEVTVYFSTPEPQVHRARGVMVSFPKKNGPNRR